MRSRRTRSRISKKKHHRKTRRLYIGGSLLDKSVIMPKVLRWSDSPLRDVALAHLILLSGSSFYDDNDRMYLGKIMGPSNAEKISEYMTGSRDTSALAKTKHFLQFYLDKHSNDPRIINDSADKILKSLEEYLNLPTENNREVTDILENIRTEFTQYTIDSGPRMQVRAPQAQSNRPIYSTFSKFTTRDMPSIGTTDPTSTLGI
jgi:hypothetical protein